MTTPLHRLNFDVSFSTFIQSRFFAGTTTHSDNNNDNDAATEPITSIIQLRLMSIKHNNNNIDATIATNSITGHIFTQSTAPEGDPRRTQDHSTDSPSSSTSINEIYNHICHKTSSIKITQQHHFIFDNNATAGSSTSNLKSIPISTLSNNDNTINVLSSIISNFKSDQISTSDKNDHNDKK